MGVEAVGSGEVVATVSGDLIVTRLGANACMTNASAFLMERAAFGSSGLAANLSSQMFETC